MSEDVAIEAPNSIENLKTAMELKGKVKRLELYGAFVDIGIGQDALLHVSQLGKRNVRNVEDVLSVDEEITVYVLKVDKEANRVALSLEKPPEVDWSELSVGDKMNGKVVRIEGYGVFVDIGAERPGMVHVSELTNDYVKSPNDVVSVGQEVEVRVLKINKKKRQIDLSMKEPAEDDYVIEDDEDQDEVPTAMELAFRRAREMENNAEAEAREAKRSRSEKRKQEQEDILARTLRDHASQ